MALTVRIESEAVVARLRAMDAQVRRALLRAVNGAAVDVVGRVQQKLSGEVLGEVSHRLHDSIHFKTTDTASGIIATVGTDVRYAAIHEYGFHGTEQVREHLRHQSVAFGRPIEPVDVAVRAHARQVNVPERSFLRSTLAELAPQIVERLEQAVAQATREAQA